MLNVLSNRLEREACFHGVSCSYHLVFNYIKSDGTVREFYAHFYNATYCHPDAPPIITMTSTAMKWICSECRCTYTQSFTSLMDLYDQGVAEGSKYSLPRDPPDKDCTDGIPMPIVFSTTGILDLSRCIDV